MTKKEAYINFCRRALDKNFWLDEDGNPPGPFVVTYGKPEELAEFQRLFGGVLRYPGQRIPIDRWKVYDAKCLELLKELVYFFPFRGSGRWWHAIDLIKKYDPKFEMPPLPYRRTA